MLAESFTSNTERSGEGRWLPFVQAAATALRRRAMGALDNPLAGHFDDAWPGYAQRDRRLLPRVY